jgi:hypothetical protein
LLEAVVQHPLDRAALVVAGEDQASARGAQVREILTELFDPTLVVRSFQRASPPAARPEVVHYRERRQEAGHRLDAKPASVKSAATTVVALEGPPYGRGRSVDDDAKREGRGSCFDGSGHAGR